MKFKKARYGVVAGAVVILLGVFRQPIVNHLPKSVQPMASKVLLMGKKHEESKAGKHVTGFMGHGKKAGTSEKNLKGKEDGVGSVSGNVPTEKLSSSVLTANVKKQLTGTMKFEHGSYVLNDNKTPLVAKVGNSTYATNEVDSMKRPTVGNALLSKETRQYKNRSQTGNGAGNWRPEGFHQLSGLTGQYRHAYDRGHLLGYALIGGIKGFNASEANPKNIATQTAWANEARSQTSRGQNYFEGLVRKALDQGKKVRYRVTDVYDGSNTVPSGAHIEAKSSDGSLEFNVFIPNVQNNIMVNYANGVATKRNVA